MIDFGTQNNIVLIITADDEDNYALQIVLAAARDGPFDVIRTGTLAEALQCIGSLDVNIVLVDLTLPDCQGITTFDRLFLAAPTIPIMILASEKEETAAIAAVQRGAQGFLTKGYFGHSLVPQALRNIIHRKAVEANLFVEKERSRVMLESIGEGVISIDLGGNLIYLNAVAERMTGWTKDDANGQPFTNVVIILDSVKGTPVWNDLQNEINRNHPVRGAAGMLLRHRDGTETAIDLSAAPVREQSGQLSGTVVVLHDASAARAEALIKLTYLAQHDSLTGLPNRLLLLERINQAITQQSSQVKEFSGF